MQTVSSFDRIGEENAFAVLARAGELAAGGMDVINLGIGQPSTDLLPVNLLRLASEDFLKVAEPKELNYGEKQGDIRFRESLADFLSLMR